MPSSGPTRSVVSPARREPVVWDSGIELPPAGRDQVGRLGDDLGGGPEPTGRHGR